MLSEKLRVALENLLPDAGEDETYLGMPTLRDAAVLIAFTDRPDPGVILTQRPQWLRSHAGQVAFPGGKIDPGDRDAIDAALREAEEETGLKVTNLRQFHTYSEPTRDPRHHTASTVFIGEAEGIPEAGDDAARAELFTVENLPPLVFDHGKILADYFAAKKQRNAGR